MKAYFDTTKNSNLSEHSTTVFNTDEFRAELIKAGFRVVTSKSYDQPGIYFVSVKNDVDWWTGDPACGVDANLNIFDLLSSEVIKELQNRNLILTIETQAEGRSFLIKGIDGYDNIHKSMDRLQIPAGNVIIITANRVLEDEYNQWCERNNKVKYFHHVYMNLWDLCIRTKLPYSMLIDVALENKESKDFNSLNRMPKEHRLAHLYMLATDPVLKDKGLVSGHYQPDYGPTRQLLTNKLLEDTVNQKHYVGAMIDNYPKDVDGQFIEKNPDHYFEAIYNHNIYSNSLLTVVTESIYDEPGIFLTEKIWKPIAAGHPFLLLGQYKYLEYLKSLGFRIDFIGIDHSYDSIKNPVERFHAVHIELRKWVQRSREEKERLIINSREILEHNFNLFRHVNFKDSGFNDIYKTAVNIKGNLLCKRNG